MPISPLAETLLRDHAKRPTRLFYDVDVLGSMFNDTALDLLDAAYAELVNNGLMESAGAVVSYFGVPKGLYRLTKSGLERAAAAPAA